MKQGQASPALGEARGLKTGLLVDMTRTMHVQILTRFRKDVNSGLDEGCKRKKP